MRTRALVAVAAAVALAGVGLLLLPSLYEVVDEGRHVRPYDSGSVYEVRLADSVTFYAAEESRPDLDVISGSVLVALATATLMMLLLLRATGSDRRLRRFYGLASAGLALLAVDEFVAVHETVGHNLLPLTDLPGVERPDDVLFAAMVVPAVVFVYGFRDILLGSRRSRWLFGAALAAFALAAVSDIAGAAADEPLEIVSGACILGGFVSLIATHASACLAPRATSEQPAAEPEREVAEPASSSAPALGR